MKTQSEIQAKLDEIKIELRFWQLRLKQLTDKELVDHLDMSITRALIAQTEAKREILQWVLAEKKGRKEK